MSKIDKAYAEDASVQEFFNPDNKKYHEAAKRREKKAEKNTKKYIKCVKEFLSEKNGGEIPPSWNMGITLLEVYYKQWLMVTYELEALDSYVVTNNVGTLIEHPLIGMQNKFSTRLEKQVSEMGLSLKSGAKLNVVEPKKAESALDTFLKKQSKVEVR